MDLDGSDCLGKVLVYEGQGEARPSGKIAGVDGLSPGGDHRTETGGVYINDQIFEPFHFLGAVDMRLQKKWIGWRSRRGESYVP